MNKPFLIDTHAHLNFRDYRNDGDEVIKRSLAEGIWMLNVGAEYKTSQRAVKYAQKYPEGVYAAVGLHPSHLEEQIVRGEINNEKIEYQSREEEFDAEKYYQLAQDKKVIAIGETGLDYKLPNVILSEAKNLKVKQKQKQVFIEQLDLARQIDRSIIIHCRQAYDDLLEILENFQVGCAACSFACPAAGSTKLKGVIHCFVGNLEQAKKFMDLGFYLGFNGIITFSDEYDDLIKKIPLERILLETDCPYLTPNPHRGKRNEPVYVKYVAEKIAQLKDIKLEQAAEQTTKNAKELFRI